MIKRLYNIWFKRKTKNFTRIPVFVMTFDWNKFQKGGKENSCMLYTLHPDIAKDEFLKEKLEKANSIVMAYTNELQTREVIKYVWETQLPLISSPI